MSGLLTRKRTVLAKLETTYGVDPTPTGAANAMLVKNLNINPLSAELVSRDLIRPYFGNSEQLLATLFVQMDFEIEAVGSGAAGTAPAYDCLLQACGLDKTVVATTSVEYKPITNSIKSVTLYYNVDGVLHKITGARGTVELSFSVKQIPVFKFSFTGLYNAPSDTAAPTVDYTAFMVPEIANTQNTPGFTLFGYSGALESVNFNMANDIQYVSLIGKEEVKLLDRKPAGTLVFEAPTMAEKDFFSLAASTTLGAMTIEHGSNAGYKVTVSAPKVNLGNPNYQDSNGVQMLSVPYTANPDVGNDELSILFE
jgi:hypothetical protein